MRHNKSVLRLCLDSMMAALFVLLSYFSFRIGNITLSLASLPLLLVSLLYPPYDAVFVALIGEFLSQVLRYGIAPTTILWMLPSALRALLVSLIAALYRNKGKYLEEHLLPYYLTMILSSLFMTLANTGVIYLDAYLYQYPAEYTAFETLYRFLTSFITSLLISTMLLPLIKALNHVSFLERAPKKEKAFSQEKRKIQ
ncbi:MAG: ECF transporter S component [Eubacteriales bacterium]|nr:ECF transporter S component [Eubacteriales bacterium]